MAQSYFWPAGGSNQSVGESGLPVPDFSTLIAGKDGTGDLIPISVDSTGAINVISAPPAGGATAANQVLEIAQLTAISGKLPAALGQTTMSGSLAVTLASDQTALAVSVASLPLPAGASTSALQTTGNSSLSSIDGKIPSGLTVTSTRLLVDGSGTVQPVSGTVAVTQSTSPWVENVSQINGVTPLMGNGITGTGSLRVTVASDNTAFTVNAAQSGTWNINDISGTISLPTGASTSALQTSGNSSLSSIDGKLNSLGQKTMANSMPVVIASDQSAITVTATNPSVSATGGAVPASATMVGGSDGTNLIAVKVSATGVVSVDGSASTQPVSGTVTANQGGAPWSQNITQIAGSAINTGNGTASGSQRVTIASDNTAFSVNAAQSGTWNINDISGTVSLPTGAATEASLAKLTLAQGSTTSGQTGALILGAVTTAAPSYTTAQSSPISLTTAGAVRVDGSAATQPVSIAAAVQIKDALNTAGSGSAAAATVSTVITLTKPSNAVGFVLQAIDTNTANIRWALGRTATTTLGQQLQPGRDTGFIPASVDISLVSESGTQTYDVQWVSQS